MPTPDIQNATDGFIYPDLSFGFNFDQAFAAQQPIETRQGLAQESLRALQSSIAFCLEEQPEVAEIEIPDYFFNVSKLRRINGYLSESVTKGHGRNSVKKRRRDVVDVDEVIEDTVDSLALCNHPVAQMSAQLYCEYGASIGHTSTTSVINDVVLVTSWEAVKQRVISGVSMWKLGKITTR